MTGVQTCALPIYVIEPILKEEKAVIHAWDDISNISARAVDRLAKAGVLDVDPNDANFVKKYPVFCLRGSVWKGKVVHNSIEQLTGSKPSEKDVKAFVRHAMSFPKADELDVYPCRMWWD